MPKRLDWRISKYEVGRLLNFSLDKGDGKLEQHREKFPGNTLVYSQESFEIICHIVDGH